MMREFDKALEVIVQVMRDGEKTHEPGEWQTRDAGFHINRAMRHLELLSAGDAREAHLSHAACRLLMAIALELRGADASLPRAMANPDDAEFTAVALAGALL